MTCSTDGAVYDWNVQTCQRENDCVVKNCSYTSIAITADLKSTFAVGSDCTLKEINLADSAVSKHFTLYVQYTNPYVVIISSSYVRMYVCSSNTVLPCTHARICTYVCTYVYVLGYKYTYIRTYVIYVRYSYTYILTHTCSSSGCS